MITYKRKHILDSQFQYKIYFIFSVQPSEKLGTLYAYQGSAEHKLGIVYLII